nr:MAG TPA: cell division protein [Caudoviricetes sp.]DAN32340.1 MAG TPA: cell division protein [Caudoviricetes sp.]
MTWTAYAFIVLSLILAMLLGYSWEESSVAHRDNKILKEEIKKLKDKSESDERVIYSLKDLKEQYLLRISHLEHKLNK